MILCFSGTGNSRRVADIIQDVTGDELVRLPPGLMSEPERVKLEVYDDRVIWVLPIHCWHMPRTVEAVLKHSVIFGKEDITHHLVCTCGDDIGYADLVWRRLIEERGWKAGSAHSVQMPNIYTFMKGFDVDTPEVAAGKLDAATKRVQQIALLIDSGDTTTVDVTRGSWPWVKTYVIRPWFNKYMTRTSKFRYTGDCMGCGRCVRNCPLSFISMIDGHPVWRKGNCTMCLRCYHSCPNHAVAYGKNTDGKGQYICPGFTLTN